MAQGKPQPKNTFTALDPVIFPTAASALLAYLAAVILANVSGKEVPRATKVIAATDSLILSTHPRTVATSPTMKVTRPIYANEMKKHGPPLQIFGGGTVAKATFHPILRKCEAASKPSISVNS